MKNLINFIKYNKKTTIISILGIIIDIGILCNTPSVYIQALAMLAIACISCGLAIAFQLFKFNSK